MAGQMKKYVDMRGVIEVRTVYDNAEDEGFGGTDDLPVDMHLFQEEYEYLPENFCAKDKYNGVQKIFWCLVCDCDMKSLVSMDSHVSGTKHHKKVVELKRVKEGLPPSNPIEKKKEKPKKPNVRADISLYLKERLERDYPHDPCLGLEYITEYVSKKEPAQYPMYTCSLQGCKSAWGESDSMVNHLRGNKLKHNKNYITYHMNDPQGASLTKDMVMDLSVQLDNESRQDNGERDYKKMKRETDHAKYRELRERPDDWSEAKAMAGVEMGRGGRGGGKKRHNDFKTDFKNPDNSNYEPIGSRKVPRMDSSRRRERSPPPRLPPLRQRSPERPWYKEVNFEERAHNHMGNLVRSRDQIKSNLKKISRNERNDLRDVTMKAMDNLKFCIKVFFSSPNLRFVEDDFHEIKRSVDILEENYNAVMNSDLKEFRRLREEVDKLDKELKMDKADYNHIKERIAKVLQELEAFKTDDKEARAMAEQLKAKALHMDKTALSLSVKAEKLSSESETEADQSYKDAFMVSLANFIRERISKFFPTKPLLLEANVNKFLQITYDAEEKKHEKSKRPWKELRLGSNISKNVGNFLQKKMEQQMTANRVLDDR